MSDAARFHGRAIFAAAAFACAAGLILALDQIGAPAAVTQAAGPGLAIAAAAAVGVAARSSRIQQFLAGSWTASPIYGALAFAAAAAGLLAASEKMPLLPRGGALAGFVISAVVVAPGLRNSGAASLADFLVNRYPGALPRAAVAVALALCGGLCAFAGFEIALTAWVEATDMSAGEGAALIGAAILCMSIPGGAASLMWSGAACAGAVFLFASPSVGQALLAGGVDTGVAALRGGLFATDGGYVAPSFWTEVGAALGVASLGGIATAAPTGRTGAKALHAGVFALATTAVLMAATFLLAAKGASSAGQRGLGLAAAALVGLALASAGTHAVASGFGAGRGPLWSARLARMRMASVVCVLCAAAASVRVGFDPASAIALAVGLALVLIGPALALALMPQAGSRQATLGEGLAIAVALMLLARQRTAGAEFGLAEALCAAAVGVLAGWLAARFAPPVARSESFSGREAIGQEAFDIPD